ncbi:MAG: alkaline phosphatase family protein [Thermoleophilaceae bacterium]
MGFGLVVLAAGGTAAALAAGGGEGVIGPSNHIQPSGRKLEPAGKLTQLGNLPAGGAITPNGRFVWTASAGRGRNDIRIVSVAGKCKRARSGHRRCRGVGRVVQTIPMPGLSGGIAMSPDLKTAYVSGLPDSSHKDQQVSASVPGREGDVIHVFKYDARRGTATRDGVIAVPPPSSATVPQNFPPTNTQKLSWPRDLAVSRDGRTLLAALNLADSAAIVDTRTRNVRYVQVGHYPYGAAITRDGKHGLVSNEPEGTVSVVDLAAGTKTADITVGPHLSHPEGIAADPKRDRAYVAVEGQDTVAVIDTKAMNVIRTLSVERPQGLGVKPVAVSVTPDGRRLLVSNAGDDSVAVFALTSSRTKRGRKRKVVAPKAFDLIGKVPAASYPVGAFGTPGRLPKLVWVAAKGLGAGPAPNGPNPQSPNDSDDAINSFFYLPSKTFGMSGILPFPGDKRLRQLTPVADRQVKPSNTESPPPGSPIAPPGPSPKIKHVFYIVRENRTYDQVLGDDARGDGDPKLTLFGSNVTPNMHALVKRFPLLDHVYANSEASIDGHFWTAASDVPDYVVKSWHQNYAGRKRPYDFGVFAVTWPSNRFLFDQAEKEGISWANYGEAVAGTVPLTDKDRNTQDTAAVATKFAKSDLGPPTAGCYPNDAEIGTNPLAGGVETYDSSPPLGAKPGAQSRFDCFRVKFTAQTLTNTVPAFNYLVLPSDHTNGTSAGARTPRAMIAENDYALGQIVDLISHSNVWDSSLILVVEDDSQDGADHVDAHRIPALAISPYAKRGAVVHTRYDFPSFIRTMEQAIGMKPLNLYDALGVPLYDAFDSSAHNTEAYGAIQPKIDLAERNPGAASANAKLARGLNLTIPDHVDQRTLDEMLWKSVHGPNSQPPPPGPNASGGD